MEYILVILLGVLSSSKMSFQTAFSKKNVKNSADALCFNIFVFIFSALLFLPRVFGCSPTVWLYALAGAVCTVAFQLLYTKALSIGNVSLTVLIVNFSMVVCVIISYFVFDEPISLIRFIAIILTILSFIICNGGGKQSQGNRGKWLMLTLFAMLSTSLGTSVQKFFGESPIGNENQAFISCLYMWAAVIGILVFPILRKREKLNFKIEFGVIKYAAAVGLSLAVYQMIYTYGIANIDGTFLFPAQTGATIVFATLSGVLIFKDRFTRRQTVGVILGLVSLVMMSF
ncbi:MAG: DMT family transporter [Ruminococcaceae bacterium]|nr:DMT family transporter [Oscillospiraceae bacterium]